TGAAAHARGATLARGAPGAGDAGIASRLAAGAGALGLVVARAARDEDEERGQGAPPGAVYFSLESSEHPFTYSKFGVSIVRRRRAQGTCYVGLEEKREC